MSDRTTTFSELVGSNLIEIGAGRPRTVNLNGHDLPILRVANVLDGRIESALQAHISYQDVKGGGSKVSRPGDVVLTTKGTVGRVALMPPDGPAFAYSPQLCFFRPAANGPLRSRFLYYWFKSSDFWIQANSLKGQTDMADFLSLGDIQRMRIGVPSLDRQDAVVGVLGALDDKIATNRRVTSTCREVGDLLMASGHSAGAELLTFADLQLKGLLAFGDGYRTKRAEHGTPGLPILRAADIAEGMLATSTQDHVSERFRPAMGQKISRPGDVVLTTKGTVGRVAIVPVASPEFVYSPQLCYFRVASGPLSPAFLFYWFRSRQFWSQADSLKGKTDMADYINLADIGSLELHVPEDANLSSRLSVLEQLAMQMQAENRTLAELRDALLPRLMSGAIRVRDAEKVVEEAL